MKLGAQLGADVPFFIYGRDAMAEGVGDRLEALPLPATRYLVAWPGVGVPTAAAFAAPELTRDTPLVKLAGLAVSVGETDVRWEERFIRCRNDLQPVVVKRYPPVAQALHWLERVPDRCGRPRMSGSGACCFAEVSSASRALPPYPPSWQVWNTASLARHPLHSWPAEAAHGSD